MRLARSSNNVARPYLIPVLVALLASLGWVYWNTLTPLVRIWTFDPQYSHGYLVPLIAAVILFLRRSRLTDQVFKPSLWAVSAVLVGIVLRLAGGYFYLTWLEQVSLLPVLAGICLAAGGRPLLNWSWPAIAFLLFMIPLPGRLEGFLAEPLQRVATLGSTNVLQTLGVFAQSEGNVILLREEKLGIVDACKGLHMLVAFFALSTAFVIVSSRPWYHRLFLVASAIPIALLCNIIRIAATGVLYETTNPTLAEFVFHDLAGWLMIPLALAFMALELWILSRIFVPRTELPPGTFSPEQLAPSRSRYETPRLSGKSRQGAGALTQS